jgi:hypothetical protein
MNKPLIKVIIIEKRKISKYFFKKILLIQA